MNHSFPASDELLEAELDERWNFTSFSSEHYHQKEEVRRDVAYSRRRATMLRAKQIPAFLEQINTDGMRATMLLQADGALQGSAGEAIDEIREQILGVVSTAMWGEFNGAGTGDLQMVLMGLEQGTLGVAKLCTGHLVCVYAEQWVHMGMIRAKLLSLREGLEGSLRGL